MRPVSNRIVVLSDSLNSNSAGQAIRQLLGMPYEINRPPLLVINSAGGRVIDTLAIHDVIRSFSGGVITLGTGVVASMAILLLAAGKRRYIFPHTTIHIHSPFGRTEIDGTRLEEIALEKNRLITRINKLIKIYTGNHADFRNLPSQGLLISPEQAINTYHIADQIITENELPLIFKKK